MTYSKVKSSSKPTSLVSFLRLTSWTTGIIIFVFSVVVLILLSSAFNTEPTAGLITLSVAFILSLIVIYINARRNARRIASSISRIHEVCQAIARDGVLVRLPLDTNDVPFVEIQQAYAGVNALADKAIKDIEAMNKLERVRTQFLANVSHELRTPIFAVQGFLETLIDGALEDENVRRQFVERAYANTMRLNTLLTDLIDLSRIESGEIQFSFRYFSLIPLIHEAIHAAEPRCQDFNIHLSIRDIPEKEVRVYGDRDRILQVLTNLLENAIKYNVENGSVFVDVHVYNGTAKITVEDTGIGIATEHQQRVFERFYRVDPARSRKVGGTGLGLAITKHILEAHKSTFALSSEVGKGTSISFTLKK